MKHAVVIAIAAAALVACKDPAPKVEPKPSADAGKPVEAAPKVTLALTLQPSQTADAAAKEAADAFAAALGEASGFEIEVSHPKSYGHAIRALRNKKAQAVLLSSWAYLKAHHHADADLLLADQRAGKTVRQSAWFVPADSKAASLKDLTKKRIAFTAPTSASGFLIPYAELIRTETVKSGADLRKAFAEVYFTGAEADSMRALIEGKVDAAAADAESAKLYLDEPSQAKVRALHTFDGEPTHVIAVRADMKAQERTKLAEALAKLSTEKPDIVKAALGVDQLVPRSHGDHMMKLQEAQELVGTEYILPEQEQSEGATTQPSEEGPAGHP